LHIFRELREFAAVELPIPIGVEAHGVFHKPLSRWRPTAAAGSTARLTGATLSAGPAAIGRPIRPLRRLGDGNRHQHRGDHHG
jgi:hypothetical protein